jgi:hypothetical protein
MRAKASNRPSWDLRLAAFAGLAFMSPLTLSRGYLPSRLPYSRRRGVSRAG